MSEGAADPVPDTACQDMMVYRATARRLQEREQQELVRRHARAWDVAHRAAQLLKTHFGATRVVVFGSLIHPECFTLWSDVDLAAWGLQPADTLRAMGAVLDLATDVALHLVDVGVCRPTLLSIIEQEGVEL